MIWWFKQIGIAAVSFFFLVLGVDTLLSAYQLNNPLEFLMFFFSSNLIILVSAVGLLVPVLHVYRRFKPSPKDESGKDDASP